MAAFTFTLTEALEPGHFEVKGTAELTSGEPLHITADLPAGKLEKAEGSVSVPLADDGHIFMNGFQTWTYCPEYTKNDRIRGIKGLPKAAIRHFGLDRYGDYYFTDYPNKKGLTHGVSYCYFREGETFRLFASLDETSGYTQFRYDAAAATLSISRDCAGLKAEGPFAIFDLFYAEGGEAEVFDAWFAAMGIRPRTKEQLVGYSSWYNRYEDINADAIQQDLAGAAGLLRSGDLFQIDDGWEPAVGDWQSADPIKFPDDMGAMAEAIHGKGLKAGLWLAPFVVSAKSSVKEAHPDWLLSVNGKPWYCGSNWGGFWALDIDNPEVIAYLEETFRRVFDEWKFDLVKLDFLYAAAPFGNEQETRAGRMIRAMKLLRKFCGDKLILGCGVPLMPAFGLVDYCRISCDVGLDWNNKRYMRIVNRERVSTRQAIENTIFRRELNGRAFGSDPDVFFLREDNIKLSEQEKSVLAKVCALFGQITLTSDDMSEYDEEKIRRFNALREFCLAEDVKVTNEERLRISYRRKGIAHAFTLPHK